MALTFQFRRIFWLTPVTFFVLGPCLMFERHTSNGVKSGKKFYACSACRDRSVCSFFHWVDDDFNDYKKKHWEQIIAASKPPYTHAQYMK